MDASKAVNEIANINFTQLFSDFFVIILGITSIVAAIGLFTDKVLKKPFKWWQKLNKDHKLLQDTVIEMKTNSENAKERDKILKENFDNFMSEMRENILENKDFIKEQVDAMTEKLRQERFEERTHDREQSFEREKRLKEQQEQDRKRFEEGFDKISNSVDKISNKLDKMKSDTDIRFRESEIRRSENEEKQNEIIEQIENLSERNRKYELSSSRTKLMQAWRYYANKDINPQLAWTEMEAHAFWEQFSSYEDNGGNDYMHSVVQPDMNRLSVIPMIDSSRIADLMKSRIK